MYYLGTSRPHLVATRPHLGATQSHLGATRPRVGIVKLGLDAPTWQYNDERGTRFVFACQGIEPCQANADAGTRRPQVRLRRPPLGLKFNVLHAIAPTEGSDAHADVLPLIANEVEVEGKLIFAV